MLIMGTTPWYGLRENGFHRPASVLKRKKEKRMKKELHFSKIFRKSARISIALF